MWVQAQEWGSSGVRVEGQVWGFWVNALELGAVAIHALYTHVYRYHGGLERRKNGKRGGGGRGRSSPG